MRCGPWSAGHDWDRHIVQDRRGKEIVVVTPVFGEIFGWEALVVLGVIALLFGGSQLPKLARSLGSAKTEFQKGLQEGHHDDPPAE
jgi:sec-independent protein translocase protein TatA